MEPKLGENASSILGCSVKELTKEPLTRVPERYLHRDLEPAIISGTSSLPPVIDLNKLFEDPNGLELPKLHLACKEWGFFQLINHGVSPELVENVKRGAKELFNLPIEEKKKLWRRAGDMEGFGQMFDVSEKQQLDWVDIFYMSTLPAHLRKPYLFPNIPLPFRDHLETYCVKMRDLANMILEFIAKALVIEEKDIKESFGEGGQSVRINCYPPCPQPEDVVGLQAHTDNAALTVLLQINEVEGLQIRKDGIWIPVKPLPNAFVLSIGDVLEIVTNGIYRSMEHRAIVNSKKERISIATFYGPEWNGNIGPAPSLVTPKRPALFRTIGVAEYYKEYLSLKAQNRDKSYIDLLRIDNDNHKGY